MRFFFEFRMIRACRHSYYISIPLVMTLVKKLKTVLMGFKGCIERSTTIRKNRSHKKLC